eukprot:1179320-Prorocentrum_minimum.AAC.1
MPWEKVGNWTQGEKRGRVEKGGVECTLAVIGTGGPVKRTPCPPPERLVHDAAGGPGHEREGDEGPGAGRAAPAHEGPRAHPPLLRHAAHHALLLLRPCQEL